MKNLKSNFRTFFLGFVIVLLGFQTNAQDFAHADYHTASISVEDQKNIKPTKIKISGDFHADRNSNGYIKTQTTNNYRYTSHFNEKLNPQIEALIIKELGQPSSTTESAKEWDKIGGKNIEGLTVTLKSGKVKIIYKHNTVKVMEKLEDLTKKICKITYHHNCD